jgi:hypothetical protein
MKLRNVWRARGDAPIWDVRDGGGRVKLAASKLFASKVVASIASTLILSKIRGASCMAVYRLFKDEAFEPEAITMMTRAYADVCHTLGLNESDRPEADAVAKKVIEFVQRGARDPVRLRHYVLEAMRS